MIMDYLHKVITLFREEIEITKDNNPSLSDIETETPLCFTIRKKDEVWNCYALYRTKDGKMWQCQREYTDDIIENIDY